jgi:CRISPR-associated protein Csm1
LPSAVYENVPDISLFDHLKSTCAIASCLSEDSNETFLGNVLKALFDKEATTNEKNTLKDEKFILIGGDLSGIQKFIYSVTSKGAAKGLRGRSFYLQLLTETISNYILHKLKISKANLLFCGGGHFYILAPSSAASNLGDMRKNITEVLLKHHCGDFYLVLDWIILSSLDFQEKRFGSKWDEIVAKLAVRKKHKFSEILNNEHHDSIFGPMGGSKDVCEICGSEKDVQEYEDEKKKCDMCASFEDLADDIANAKYIVEIIEEKENEPKKGWKEAISDFAIGYEFPLEIDKRIKKTDAKDITIYTLNDTNFPDYFDMINGGASPISFGFKFLANTTPKDNGKIKSFDDFAEKAEGIKKWSVLRMDVDNLGKIFSKGLGKNRSISRISTLSSMFSLFFAGGMEKICDNYKNVYVIYSGGDDLFIVGQWDIIPTVAKNIYTCFKEFTCQNENITISGGIFIAPDTKFPLYKAAYLAGEALDKSKNGGRDKITFFDKDVTWEDFDEIEKMKGYIVSAIIDKHVSRALIFRLAEAFDDYKSIEGEKKSVFRIWRLIYNLNRLARRHKEAEQELKKIEKSFIADNLLKSYVIVPIRWAEFLTRKEGY